MNSDAGLVWWLLGDAPRVGPVDRVSRADQVEVLLGRLGLGLADNGVGSGLQLSHPDAVVRVLLQRDLTLGPVDPRAQVDLRRPEAARRARAHRHGGGASRTPVQRVAAAV